MKEAMSAWQPLGVAIGITLLFAAGMVSFMNQCRTQWDLKTTGDQLAREIWNLLVNAVSPDFRYTFTISSRVETTWKRFGMHVSRHHRVVLPMSYWGSTDTESLKRIVQAKVHKHLRGDPRKDYEVGLKFDFTKRREENHGA